MFDDTNTIRLSSRVIEAVAGHTGVDPLELPPLYDAIDPDALDALFRGHGGPGSVSFVYENRHVTVTSEGDVTLAPVERDASTITEP